jgi:hypothetical protein
LEAFYLEYFQIVYTHLYKGKEVISAKAAAPKSHSLLKNQINKDFVGLVF